jgi:hypothetical protein
VTACLECSVDDLGSFPAFERCVRGLLARPTSIGHKDGCTVLCGSERLHVGSQIRALCIGDGFKKQQMTLGNDWSSLGRISLVGWGFWGTFPFQIQQESLDLSAARVSAEGPISRNHPVTWDQN